MKRETVYKHALEYFDGDDLAADVWVNKYALRDGEDYKEKTPDDMFWRVASEFARVEKGKFKEPLTESQVYELMKDFKYIQCQGSPMYGIGNDYTIQSLGNCFVLGEHPYDSYGGILYADQMIVNLCKRRCGVGLSLDKLRPKGLTVKNSAHTTSGIASFMERFSNSIREVGQENRRGAGLLALSVHHPEIETFINIKRDVTKVTGANVSVLASDDFMEAVKNDEKYEQRWPVESSEPIVSKMVSARKIWNQIIDSVHSSGDPGLQFIQNSRKYGTSHMYHKIDKRMKDVCSNPCYHPDNYLLTEKGYIQLKDLIGENPVVITDNRIEFNEEQNDWYINKDKFGTTVRQGYNVHLTKKDAKILKIVTNFGYEIKVTPDHHIATNNGMIEAKNLDIENDEILIPKVDNDKTALKLPTTIEEIDAFLMGFIVGDGNISKKSYNIVIDLWDNNKESTAKFCTKLIDILYNDAMIYSDKNYKFKLKPYGMYYIKNGECLRISSSCLGRYLKRKYNFTAHNKHEVPKQFIYNAREKHVLYYLSSLFYCDGSVEGDKHSLRVILYQSNKKMLKQIQLILHAHGMIFSLKKKKLTGNAIKKSNKQSYVLYSVANSCVDFYQKIRIFHNEKDIKLKSKVDKYKEKIGSEKRYSKIKSIIKIDNNDVYCLEEPITKSVIVNGITARRCGEIIPGFDSCRLMLQNLYSYVKLPFTPNAYFDYKLYHKHVILAQRLMDDMVDLEIEKMDKILDKIDSDPEPDHIKQPEKDMWKNYKETAFLGRRSGLGITGLGDTLAALGLQYGTKESINETEKIYKELAIASMESSCLMAKELGPFPLYDPKIEEGHPFLKRLFEASPEVKELHDKYGRRNISLTTTAPAGSVSILTKTTSGIEPVFLLEYTRRRKLSDNDNFEPDFVDSKGDRWKEYTVFHHHFNTWKKITGKNKIEDSPYFRATSNDTNWKASVDIQAVAQKWITHSISKTCNLPNNTSKELMSEIYIDAYDKGLKGFTSYRDGSKDGVLNKKDDKFSKEEAENRPKILDCEVYHYQVQYKPYFVLVGLLNDKPYEVFAGKNGFIKKKVKKGTIERIKKPKCYRAILEDDTVIQPITVCCNEDEEAMTRLVSTSLRNSTPVSMLVDQLEKVRGDMNSFAKCIARSLKTYIPDGTSVDNDCPECETRSLVRQEGCMVCKNCGYSACG